MVDTWVNIGVNMLPNRLWNVPNYMYKGNYPNGDQVIEEYQLLIALSVLDGYF